VSLIDGVIVPGSLSGWDNCLAAVTQLTGIATSAGGTAFGSAADLASYASSAHILSSVPALGDIAVWGANVGGANSEYGHAAIVTGVSSAGVQVTGTSWGAPNQGETQMTVGAAGAPGTPSGYINPVLLGGKNIITGSTSTAVGAVTTLAGSGATVSGSGSNAYQTLAQESAANPWSLTNPFGTAGLFSFLGESATKYRIGADILSVALGVVGLWLLLRQTPLEQYPAAALNAVPGVKV
jgi:hypothetical protein